MKSRTQILLCPYIILLCQLQYKHNFITILFYEKFLKCYYSQLMEYIKCFKISKRKQKEIIHLVVIIIIYARENLNIT
jgi:hypothetical protein